MDSAYRERVQCLEKLDNEKQGFLKKGSLEKEINNTKEAINFFENAIKRRGISEGDYVNAIQTTEEKISKIKKASVEKLKKDLSVENKKLDEARNNLKESKKRYNNFKKSIREGKKLIASNTKKIKKIKKLTDKCYEKERKRDTGKKRARCPNGTRKNNNTGKCENK